MRNLLAVCILFAAGVAQGAALFHESFEATSGNAEGKAWHTSDASAVWISGGTAVEAPLTSSNDLLYAGSLQAAAGNGKIKVNSPNQSARGYAICADQFTVSEGSVYHSFLLRVDNFSGINTNWHKSNWFMSLRDSASGSGNLVALRSDGAGGGYIMTARTEADLLIGPSDADCSDEIAISAGTTYLIVTGVDDVEADSSPWKLWVDPSSLGGNEPEADSSATWRTYSLSVRSVYIGNDENAGGESVFTSVYVDELRVGQTFADVTPQFPGYTLRVFLNDPLAGGVEPSGGYFPAGSNVTLTAAASNHYYFVNWSGSISGTNAVTNIVMDANKTITANFAPDPFVLTVQSAYGAPSPDGSITNAYGTVLTNTVNSPVMNGLTQYVCTGWTLSGNDPVSGTTNGCVMTITNTPVLLTWLWKTNLVTAPILSVAPQALSFAYTTGEEAPVSQSFTVTNIGAGLLDVSVGESAGWLQVTPESASGLGTGGGATFTVSLLTNGLTAGISNATVTLTGDGAENSPQTVAVQLTVKDPFVSQWPAFGGGNNRRFYTEEVLEQPLAKAWVHKLQEPTPEYTYIPQVALQAHTKFHPVQYDRAPSSIAVSNRLYTAASTEEAVFCLDAATGAAVWTFHAEGAVRLAPSYANGKVYFGSDDGYAYCVNANDGSLVWKVSASTGTPRRAVFNSHLASAWPVRTGVTVEGGYAYFGGGYLSPHGSYLCRVNAETGELSWRQSVPYNLAGYILLTGDKLYAGTGRTAPVEYDKATGTPTFPTLPSIPRREGGGIHLSLLDNGMLTYGPSENGVSCVRVTTNATSTYFSTDTGNRIPGSMAYINATRILKDADRFYFLHVNEAPQHAYFGQSLFSVPVSVATNEFWESVNNFSTRSPSAYSDAAGRTVFWNWGSGKFAGCGEPVLINRLTQTSSWSVAGAPILSGLLTPNALYIGGTNELHAYNPASGALLWSAVVTGSVYELSLAHGALYAGTDAGYIYCFSNSASGTVDEGARVYSSPYPTNDSDYAKYVEAAELAVTNAETSGGYCVVLGAGEGRLAYEIAKRSDFFVLGLETDPVEAAAAREKLMQAGVYGSRVVIHEDMDELFPHPDYFANLIVSEELLMNGSMPYSSREIFRMLQPYGGTVLFGNKDGNLDLTSWVADDMTVWSSVPGGQGITWKMARRGEPEGFGKWNFQMADAGNTLCSGDELVKDDFQIQWVQEITPDKTANRHYVAASPLAADGKLVNIGLDYITVADAYNGTILWEMELAKTIRQVAPLDAPMMYLGNDRLYVASSNTCYVFNANNGTVLNTFRGPAPDEDWGYTGVYSNRLFGSNQKPTASLGLGMDVSLFYQAGAGGSWPAISHTLFAKNPTNGTTLWSYTNAVALNSSITLGGSHLFAAVSSNTAAMTDADGRVALADFLASGSALIALDIETGEKMWERPLGLFAGSKREEALFLSYDAGRIFLVQTYWNNPATVSDAYYLLTVLNAADGSQVGSTIVLGGGVGGKNETDHNGVLLRPNLINGKAYMRTYKATRILEVNLADASTNLLTIQTVQAYKGCSPPAASATHLYHRGYANEAIRLSDMQATDLTTSSRPGCWPTLIPAGGLLTMYDGSAGCSCGMAIQASMALAPVTSDTQAPSLFNVVALDDSTVVVVFDEAVNKTVAEDENNYSLDNGITVLNAVRQSNHLERVTLTVSAMGAGTNTLTVSGVEDLYGNAMGSQPMSFESGAADTDEDGLPDSWEQQYFGNPTNAIASVDSDEDGLSNYDEYIAGTSPVDPFSVLLVENIISAPGIGYVVTWTPQTGRTYNVLWTADLTTPFTSLVSGISFPQSSWTDTLHGADSEGFYKIEVELE